MATFEEFMKVAEISIKDKTSHKRMNEIVRIMRQYKVLHGLTPEQAVEVLQALGPTYVKIGQLASNRSDLLPKAYCDAFEKLRDDANPMPFDVVIEQIDRAYGKSWHEVIASIDPVPLGAASIAQVHKATLLDGTTVAVKVRRPGVAESMAEDIMLMKHLLALGEFASNSHRDILLSLEGFIEEMMNGQKVVKVFCHEKAAERDFDVLNEQLFRDSESAHRFANIFGPIMNNIGNLLYVLTAFAGGLLITAGQSVSNLSIQNLVKTGALIAPLSISVVASYLGMCKQFTANVSQVSQQFNAIAMAIAGAGRIFELLEQQPEADEGTDTLVNCREENGVLTECAERTGSWAWKCPRKDGSAELVPLRGDVRFFDVDFAYVPGKTVLHDISLYAKPGQKLAFVGATGAGKTTITNLINRFYDIADGKIRYDGVNINHIKKADLRHSLGIVLQDVNLFTGTVMENIRYGKLDATDEECIAAAKLANAHDFITRLPDGYDTMLTANGANLSQGQRQLLSIARAAVADPPVMILDEATSSIDTRTELLVQRGMDALMKGRTVFVIAHRLSTVQNSDAIMVLDHGRIIERGTHDDLIAQKGTYYQLYTGAFELE